jgi:hypothetical protein
MGRVTVSNPGAIILTRTHKALTTYVSFPDAESADAWTLLITATHAQDIWDHATRGLIESVTRECGKSTLLEVTGELSHNPLHTVNISAPALARSIDVHNPFTILFDEIDRIYANQYRSESCEILTGVLNNGFGRQFPYIRWDMAEKARVEFSCYSMAIMACMGLDILPDTVTSRSIIIRMFRAKPGDYTKYRSRRDSPALNRLRDEIHEWVIYNLGQLIDTYNSEPNTGLDGRQADKWEPLIAIADVAGGEWPKRARKAASYLESRKILSESVPIGIQLLTDMRELFTISHAPFISSMDMTTKLVKMQDSPWADLKLSPHKVSEYLKSYGLTPGRNSTGSLRGYRLDDALPVFTRYLAIPPSESVRERQTAGHSFKALTASDGQPSDRAAKCQTVSAGQTVNGHSLTLSDGGTGQASQNGATESPEPASPEPGPAPNRRNRKAPVRKG